MGRPPMMGGPPMMDGPMYEPEDEGCGCCCITWITIGIVVALTGTILGICLLCGVFDGFKFANVFGGSKTEVSGGKGGKGRKAGEKCPNPECDETLSDKKQLKISLHYQVEKRKVSGKETDVMECWHYCCRNCFGEFLTNALNEAVENNVRAIKCFCGKDLGANDRCAQSLLNAIKEITDKDLRAAGISWADANNIEHSLKPMGAPPAPVKKEHVTPAKRPRSKPRTASRPRRVAVVSRPSPMKYSKPSKSPRKSNKPVDRLLRVSKPQRKVRSSPPRRPSARTPRPTRNRVTPARVTPQRIDPPIQPRMTNGNRPTRYRLRRKRTR